MKKYFGVVLLCLICFWGTLTVSAACGHWQLKKTNYTMIDDDYHSYREVCTSCGATINTIQDPHWMISTNTYKKKDENCHLVPYKCYYDCGAEGFVEEEHRWFRKFGDDGAEYIYKDNDYHLTVYECIDCGEIKYVEEKHFLRFIDNNCKKKDAVNHIRFYKCMDCGETINVEENHVWAQKYEIYQVKYEYKKKDSTYHLTIYECGACGETKGVEEKHDWVDTEDNIWGIEGEYKKKDKDHHLKIYRKS